LAQQSREKKLHHGKYECHLAVVMSWWIVFAGSKVGPAPKGFHLTCR
jgi:hypothetical protein